MAQWLPCVRARDAEYEDERHRQERACLLSGGSENLSPKALRSLARWTYTARATPALIGRRIGGSGPRYLTKPSES